MQKRRYGKDGELLSIIGFAGIIVKDEKQDDADRFAAEAIDRGVNYFDVAPSYGDAEIKLGHAIRGKRDKLFLACKTAERTSEGSEKELRESFHRLKTDYFDLYQIHAVASLDDVDVITGPGGCLETFVKAKEQGYIRHIGFSAHSEEAAEALMDMFDFDSVLFPYNWVNIHTSGFGKRIYTKAIAKNITRLALKAMALTVWGEEEREYPKCWYKPVADPELADLALRFTLSADFVSAVTPSHMELFRLAADIADDFRPLDKEEMRKIKEESIRYKPIF